MYFAKCTQISVTFKDYACKANRVDDELLVIVSQLHFAKRSSTRRARARARARVCHTRLSV